MTSFVTHTFMVASVYRLLVPLSADGVLCFFGHVTRMLQDIFANAVLRVALTSGIKFHHPGSIGGPEADLLLHGCIKFIWCWTLGQPIKPLRLHRNGTNGKWSLRPTVQLSVEKEEVPKLRKGGVLCSQEILVIGWFGLLTKPTKLVFGWFWWLGWCNQGSCRLLFRKSRLLSRCFWWPIEGRKLSRTGSLRHLRPAKFFLVCRCVFLKT